MKNFLDISLDNDFLGITQANATIAKINKGRVVSIKLKTHKKVDNPATCNDIDEN